MKKRNIFLIVSMWSFLQCTYHWRNIRLTYLYISLFLTFSIKCISLIHLVYNEPIFFSPLQQWSCSDGVPSVASVCPAACWQNHRAGPPHPQGPHLQDCQPAAGLLLPWHAGLLDVPQLSHSQRSSCLSQEYLLSQCQGQNDVIFIIIIENI